MPSSFMCIGLKDDIMKYTWGNILDTTILVQNWHACFGTVLDDHYQILKKMIDYYLLFQCIKINVFSLFYLLLGVRIAIRIRGIVKEVLYTIYFLASIDCRINYGSLTHTKRCFTKNVPTLWLWKKKPNRYGSCINVKFAKRLRAIVDNNINLTE